MECLTRATILPCHRLYVRQKCAHVHSLPSFICMVTMFSASVLHSWFACIFLWPKYIGSLPLSSSLFQLQNQLSLNDTCLPSTCLGRLLSLGAILSRHAEHERLLGHCNKGRVVRLGKDSLYRDRVGDESNIEFPDKSRDDGFDLNESKGFSDASMAACIARVSTYFNMKNNMATYQLQTAKNETSQTFAPYQRH